jgi:hypothetical protein
VNVPALEAAQLLCYRIFDIANEIDLAKVQTRLQADTRRLSLSRENSQYLQLPDPPVTVELGRQSLPLASGARGVEALGRIFAHGAASIILKVPVAPGTPFEALVPLADELYDSPEVDVLAGQLMERLRQDIREACESPHLWGQTESYTVTFVQRFAGPVELSSLSHSAELARLLVGERAEPPLAGPEQSSITSTRFSYREDDLVVIDWNSAFVVEPSGSTDIPDLLEICNAQLLEFRYYDEILEKELQSTYDELQQERARQRTRLVRSPYARLSRRLLTTVLETNEFVERVENSLKVIGDFYLAKVYEGATRRLRVHPWKEAVTRKQQLLAQTYQLLRGEVDTTRSLTLETAIVVLIVVELVLALWPGHGR